MSLDAHTVRQRAINLVRSQISCEAFSFTFANIDGVPHYAECSGSAAFIDLLRKCEGRRAFPGSVHSTRVRDWNIENPLRLHTNRFAAFGEDQDIEKIKRTTAWNRFYEPAGIEDQLRGLFYCEGRFLGFFAAVRSDRSSFTRDERDRLNRIRGRVWEHMRLAESLSQAEDVGFGHIVLDENGEAIYASSSARIWLDDRRRRLIRDAIQNGKQLVLDGMVISRTSMKDHGLEFACLSAYRRMRRGVDYATPRQLEIARLASSGLSNAEIAEIIGISSSTVKYHLQKLYDSFGVNGRAGLALQLID